MANDIVFDYLCGKFATIMRKFFFFVFLTLFSICSTNSSAQQRTMERGMAEHVANSFIWRFPNPDVIRWGGQENHFSWQAGYIMFAMEHLWLLTGNPDYLSYVRRYVDQNVTKEGEVPGFQPRALDNFLPGYACLLMYEITGEERYAKAAETIRRGFDNYPRNKYGVFHHSLTIPQLWDDGVFMGQIFLARYARTMNHPEDFQEVAKQITGALNLCGMGNGMLYHGWAEKGLASWAKEKDNHSPEAWSEGMGWMAVLLADVIDYLPANMQERNEMVEALKRMCEALAKCQDEKTGMWCQVPDKPGKEGNWNETSGTAMFIYILQKAIDDGYIDEKEYKEVVQRAYQGLLNKVVRNNDGAYNLLECSSIGIKGSYAEYVSQTKEVSTFAAFGSFILAAGIVENRMHRKGVALQDIRLSDPAILADEKTKTYYMTGTGGMIWRSKDLQRWDGPYRVTIFDKDSWMGSHPMVWAAELHQKDGLYYYFATFTNRDVVIDTVKGNIIERRACQVFRADNPMGPYQAFGDSIYLPANRPTLDGTLWRDTDGKPYMVFCGEWLQNWNGTIEKILLKDDFSGTIGEPKVLFRASDSPWSREKDENGQVKWNKVTDGPWLFRTNTGKLGMLWTSWVYDNYTQGVAYSESGGIDGPWVQQMEPVTPPNYGHSMLFRRFDGQWMMSVHSHAHDQQGRTVRTPHLFEVDLSGDKLVVKY